MLWDQMFLTPECEVTIAILILETFKDKILQLTGRTTIEMYLERIKLDASQCPSLVVEATNKGK